MRVSSRVLSIHRRLQRTLEREIVHLEEREISPRVKEVADDDARCPGSSPPTRTLRPQTARRCAYSAPTVKYSRRDCTSRPPAPRVSAQVATPAGSLRASRSTRWTTVLRRVPRRRTRGAGYPARPAGVWSTRRCPGWSRCPVVATGRATRTARRLLAAGGARGARKGTQRLW